MVAMPAHITPREKLLEKVRSFSDSDRWTPIIGDLIHAVQSAHAREEKEPIKRNENIMQYMSYWQEPEPDQQYPNESADWMLDYALESLPGFEYHAFMVEVGKLGEYGTVDDFLNLRLFCEPEHPKTTFPVVFEDQILGGVGTIQPPPKPERVPVRPQDALPLPAERKRPHPEPPEKPKKEKKEPHPDPPEKPKKDEDKKTVVREDVKEREIKTKDDVDPERRKLLYEACKARKIARGVWKPSERAAKPGKPKSRWAARGGQGR